MTLLIQHATIMTPTQTLTDRAVLVENGRIHTIAPTSEISVIEGATVINANGRTLVPGFIDLQCNGGFGHDFTHNPDTIWTVAAKMPCFGVTAFLPTIITSPLQTVKKAQKVMGERPSHFIGSTPLGLHLEGPFLNPQKKGAHNPAHLRLPPAPEELDWSKETAVSLVTLAPEQAGAIELITVLAGRGIIVSVGHSLATVEEGNRGIEAGVRYATHLFNAMPTLHHRQPGLIGSVLADERITIGLIADGVHVHPSLIKLIWQAVGSRLNVVTDAMAAMGNPPGQYQIGDQTVFVTAADARLADGTLAGCIAPMDEAMRNLLTFTDCTLSEALTTITTVPAKLLGLSRRKGQIAPGFDADMVLLTADYQVSATIIAGELLYEY